MVNPSVAELKVQIANYVDAHRDELIEMSLTLHADPEFAFEEYESMALLSGAAEKAGYQVDRGVAGLETAFVAISDCDRPGPSVAFVAEYDALPGLGHACGHNIIGTAATGAALAVQSVREQLPGRLMLIGTPAEEEGGGKVIMVERGIFDGVDAAMMVHPGTKAMTTRGTLASNKVDFEFFGKAAHAAGAPDMGVNALDACIQTFNSINALRQHLTPDVRIHGIITHGGDAVNIVPKYTAASFSVRAASSDVSFEVLQKVIRCAEAGAMGAGATMEYKHFTHYANRIANPTMARLFGENIMPLGEDIQEPLPDERMGSSDMGNVSQVVPSIHPYIVIADPGIGGHTPEFAVAAASQRGHDALIRSAKAMALTAVDLLTQPELMAQAKQEFVEAMDFGAEWRKLRFHT